MPTKKSVTIDETLIDLNQDEREIVAEIRKIIVTSSDSIVEGIKWKVPSYSIAGNDIITFNFRNYKCVSLIFHTGPKGKDTHTGKKLFSEFPEIIEWLADKRFVIKVMGKNWVNGNEKILRQIIQMWVTFAGNNFEYQ